MVVSPDAGMSLREGGCEGEGGRTKSTSLFITYQTIVLRYLPMLPGTLFACGETSPGRRPSFFGLA